MSHRHGHGSFVAWVTALRYRLLECDFGKASQLARMQALAFLVLELFERLQADLEMLADASR